MLSAMFFRPVTGSNGMLWYTASSVKNAARSSAPRSLAHPPQNLLTRSTGFSLVFLLISLGLSVMRCLPVARSDRSRREQQLLANPFFLKEAVGLGGFRHRERRLRAQL